MKHLLAIAAFVAGTGAALAMEAPVDIEILPGWRGEDGVHYAALHVVLKDGWKTYWRAPGDAGVPPLFDWSDSQNLGGTVEHWPVPEVFDSGFMTTVGYTRELVLPIEVHPAAPGADVVLSGRMTIGVCHEVCMPVQRELSGLLPAGARDVDPLIAAALDARPDTAQEAGLESAHCTLTPIADGMRVEATLVLPAPGAVEYVVFEPDDRSIWVSEAVSTRDGAVLTSHADLVPPQAAPFAFDPATLRITVIAGGRAVDIQGCAD